jgi:hypothetical protein
LIGAQQLRELAGIDSITLVAVLQQSCLSRITDHQPAEMGLEQIV